MLVPSPLSPATLSGVYDATLLTQVLIILDYAPSTRLCQEYPTCLFIAMLSYAKGLYYCIWRGDGVDSAVF
ncbi:hypothetical protein CVT26_004863 [Gymnopilus dilepis]|uniref:Uncharacterized protein n=1 Tax=Gymnopilus dilepis TaxID=231916 RepID=A0A409YTQ7_9AGAR|nr:hypothetical protein CVT26_004863 [Gymnopilus dilepis]